MNEALGPKAKAEMVEILRGAGYVVLSGQDG
jgi:hypothetical protein